MPNGNNRRRRNNRNRRNNKSQRVTRPMSKNVNSNKSGNGLSNRGRLVRPMITKPFIESGSDFLGTVTIRANPTTSERILIADSISPSAFSGTRLTQLSQLWERYRFRKFRLRWVPAVPKTIACQLIIYQDTDPLDDPSIITDPNALIRQATAQTGSQQFNFINACAIDLAQRSDRSKLYYTGADKQNERFTRQGNFYVIQVTDPINFNGDAITTDIMSGSLYVDWTCEFQIAQINPSALFTIASARADVSNTIDYVPSIQTTATIQILEPTYISASNISGSFNAVAAGDRLTLRVNGTSIGYSNHSADGFNTERFPILLNEGTYNVDINATDSGTLNDPASIDWFNRYGKAPVITIL